MLAAAKDICTVDIVFFTILLVSTVVGTVRGASGEIARLLSLVCGALAMWLAQRFLTSSLGVGQMPAFCVALLATILVVILAHKIARKVIRLILGQPADSICGALMAFTGAFIILAVMWCGIMVFIPQRVYDNYFADSYAKKAVHPLVVKIQEKQAGKQD